jgi:hypothetical protein
LLFDQYEFISTAAVQLMRIWVLTYEMDVPSPVIIDAAAALS